MNKTKTAHSVICVCAVAALSFAAAVHAADSPRAAIEAANKQFSAAAAKGDGAGVAAAYATDGRVMPAGSEPIKGADAIQKFWQGVIDSGVATADLKTVEVYGHGPTATEVGEYVLKDKAAKVIDYGKYIVIWKHEGESWKILRDMFSSNVPPKK